MSKTWIQHALIIALAVQTVLATAMARGSVLCTGDDGHVRIETPLEHVECRDVADGHGDCHDTPDPAADEEQPHDSAITPLPCQDVSLADPVLGRPETTTALSLAFAAIHIALIVEIIPPNHRDQVNACPCHPPGIDRSIASIVLLI